MGTRNSSQGKQDAHAQVKHANRKASATSNGNRTSADVPSTAVLTRKSPRSSGVHSSTTVDSAPRGKPGRKPATTSNGTQPPRKRGCPPTRNPATTTNATQPRDAPVAAPGRKPSAKASKATSPTKNALPHRTSGRTSRKPDIYNAAMPSAYARAGREMLLRGTYPTMLKSASSLLKPTSSLPLPQQHRPPRALPTASSTTIVDKQTPPKSLKSGLERVRNMLPLPRLVDVPPAPLLSDDDQGGGDMARPTTRRRHRGRGAKGPYNIHLPDPATVFEPSVQSVALAVSTREGPRASPPHPFAAAAAVFGNGAASPGDVDEALGAGDAGQPDAAGPVGRLAHAADSAQALQRVVAPCTEARPGRSGQQASGGQPVAELPREPTPQGLHSAPEQPGGAVTHGPRYWSDRCRKRISRLHQSTMPPVRLPQARNVSRFARHAAHRGMRCATTAVNATSRRTHASSAARTFASGRSPLAGQRRQQKWQPCACVLI